MNTTVTNQAGDYEFVGFENGLAIYRTGAPAVAYDIPAAPVALAVPAPRAVRIYRAAVIALLIVIAALATVTGILASHHDTAAPGSTTSVSSFNDGFSDSKADDCQQGFAAACAWLRSN